MKNKKSPRNYPKSEDIWALVTAGTHLGHVVVTSALDSGVTRVRCQQEGMVGKGRTGNPCTIFASFTK